MSFIDLTHEFGTNVSINTDYIIAIGENMSGKTYVTTTRDTIYLKDDFQTTLNKIKHAVQQDKIR